MQLLEKMSYNPIRLYDFDAGYIAVVDQRVDTSLIQKRIVGIGSFRFKSGQFTIVGETLKGESCSHTICDGQVIFQDKRRVHES